MKSKLIAITLALLCVGCATRREKAITYMNDNPEDLAALCASNFPPKIEYKPGKTIHTSDTVYTEGEKVPCPPNEKGEVVYVRGRNMIVRDTVFKTDTAIVRDLAFEQVLRTTIEDLNRDGIKKDAKISSIKKTRNISFWVNGIFLVLGLGYAAIKRYMP